MRGDSLDVLVTGGAGFIGSHVVDRLLARGHRPRIFDQRPSPWHASADVDECIGDLGDVPRLRSAMADCDVGRPSGRRRRCRPRPRGPARRRAAQRSRDAERVGGGAADRRRPCDLRLDDLGLLGHARRLPRGGLGALRAGAPLHRDEARRRAVLPLLPRAVRARVHGAAVRHPLRPARPAGRRGRAVRRPRAGRRAARRRGRRAPVAPVRLRRGSRGRRRAGAHAGGREPHLQPRRQRGHEHRRHRRVGPRPRRRRRDRARAGPCRRLQRRPCQRRARRPRARVGGADAVRDRPQPVRRLAARGGGLGRARAADARAAARSGRCCAGRRSRWSPPPRSR